MFATSGTMAEAVREMALATGLMATEMDMSANLIKQSLIIDAAEAAWTEGFAEGEAKGRAMGCDRHPRAPYRPGL